MPKTCPQCQSEAADNANNCSNCGAPLGQPVAQQPRRHPHGRRPAARRRLPALPAPGSSRPGLQFDAGRWSLADRIAGVATIVLFICLFLPWFTLSGSSCGLLVPCTSVNGLWHHGWMFLR